MKRITTFLFALFMAVGLFAQSPEKMSYQAVVRDVNGNLITNQTVGMQVSILQGSASGTAVYVETHSLETNVNGLLSIEIGAGSVLSGSLDAINWSAGPYFLKSETDPEGGTNYSITGISQLLSVPYALHAKEAENVANESDPVYSASPAADVTQNDIVNLDNLSGVNTGDQDISGIAENSLAIQDTAAQIRADIPDVSGFITEEVDPVYTASEAANITAEDITNLDNLSGINTGDQDITGIGMNTQAIMDTAVQIRSDIPDVSGFITEEVDPVYTADSAFLKTGVANWNGSLAHAITSSDTMRWGTDVSISNELQVLSVSNDTVYLSDGGFAKLPAETDPVFSASVAAAITDSDIDSWNSKLDTLIAGDGIEISGDTVSASAKTYQVGDFAMGGIIFWVDESGQHGLVCAKQDIPGDHPICDGHFNFTMAHGDGLFAGKANTTILIVNQEYDYGSLNLLETAAFVCNKHQVTEGGVTYGDWYLPSKQELLLMYQSKDMIDSVAVANGGVAFVDNFYWSSTEINGIRVWFVSFITGNASDDLTKDYWLFVRPMRSF